MDLAKVAWAIGHAEGGYTVLACVEGVAALYVIFEGPISTTRAPKLKQVEAKTPTGAPLRFRKLSISSDDNENELVVATFDQPPPDTDHVDVTLEIEGVTACSARVVRVSP